jgi:hypothetical protein
MITQLEVKLLKVKVSLINKRLANEYFSILSVIGIVVSFLLIGIEIPKKYKVYVGAFLIACMFLIYISLWIKANLLSKANLKINNSTMEVKIGDIFSESDFKVIAFNEYFDTQVDNKIIAESTLNGMYIRDYIT